MHKVEHLTATAAPTCAPWQRERKRSCPGSQRSRVQEQWADASHRHPQKYQHPMENLETHYFENLTNTSTAHSTHHREPQTGSSIGQRRWHSQGEHMRCRGGLKSREWQSRLTPVHHRDRHWRRRHHHTCRKACPVARARR